MNSSESLDRKDDALPNPIDAASDSGSGSPLYSIFTIPKPFHEHIGIIQRNAIASWLKLPQVAEVILLGDELGVADTANEMGAICLDQIEKSDRGVPLISDAFQKGAVTIYGTDFGLLQFGHHPFGRF